MQLLRQTRLQKTRKEKNKYNKMQKENKFQNKSFYAQDDSSVSKISNESSSEHGTSEFMLMTLEYLEEEINEYEE